ncbi:MAG TPA: beta-eliminating lyase-related protein [Gaiellaceae bacterium]
MDEWRDVWRGCERFAFGMPGPGPGDRYGEGGSVERLEGRVAGLLGKDAAVWMPSGTMAQQIALRIHADARSRRAVAFHPYCHLDTHEERGYAVLHGLHAVHLGSRERLVRAADVEALREPVAAVLLEIPQRDLGGQVPEREDLVATCEAARARGAALHLDGARLWQCPDPGEIAALFDTVYVSLYKDLGAPAGCVLAGPADFVAEARVWQIRHGGRMFSVAPLVEPAERALDEVLPRMGELRAHARESAAALNDLDGVTILPCPPHAAMFHAFVRRPLDALNDAVTAVARETGVWPGCRGGATEDPEVQRCEVTATIASLAVPVGETVALWRDVLSRSASA